MATILVIAAVAVAVLVEIVIRHRRSRLDTPADYLRAGDRALQRGRLEEAEQHYRESIRLDHANPEAHFKLSLVAWERGDFQRVIDHLQDCQRWAPEAAQVEHGLGAAHYHLGDHEAALRHYHRARELDPENEEVRGSLAALYHELGRVAEAKEVWPEFEPPTAEEVERGKRIARQLEGRGERELRRWDKTVDAVVWVWSAARIGFFAWIAWWVLKSAYEWIAGPGTVPAPGRVFVTGFRIAYLSVWGALLVLRLMESYRDRYVRWVMRRAGVAAEDMEAQVPRAPEPPWWKVELSGVHLVLWLSIPYLVYVFSTGSGSRGWTFGVVLYVTCAWAVKVGFWAVFIVARPDRRATWWAGYRWFATARGALFGLVVIPGAAAGVGWLLLSAIQRSAGP